MNITGIYQKQGRLDEALNIYLLSWNRFVNLLRPEQAETLIMTHDIAGVYYDMNESEVLKSWFK